MVSGKFDWEREYVECAQIIVDQSWYLLDLIFWTDYHGVFA